MTARQAIVRPLQLPPRQMMSCAPLTEPKRAHRLDEEKDYRKYLMGMDETQEVQLSPSQVALREIRVARANDIRANYSQGQQQIESAKAVKTLSGDKQLMSTGEIVDVLALTKSGKDMLLWMDKAVRSYGAIRHHEHRLEWAKPVQDGKV